MKSIWQRKLSATVRAMYKNAGYTQRTLGDRLGITREAVGYKLGGSLNWTLDDFFVLADAFAMSAGEFADAVASMGDV